jgi:hypothetical protein
VTDRDQQLLAYLAERDAMLLRGDPDELMVFMRKHNLHQPSCREAAELTLHKTITGVMSLPLEYRLKSKAWLDARGYHSLDDGELTHG